MEQDTRLLLIKQRAKELEKKKQKAHKQSLTLIDQTLRNMELLNDGIRKTNFLLKDILR